MKHGAFRMREHLGHEWRNELVGFSWRLADAPVVTDPAGKRLPAQLSGGKVWFVVERLPSFGRQAYRWRMPERATRRKPSATARKDGNSMVLSNGTISIRVPATRKVRKGCRSLPAPIQGLRSKSAPWIGGGVLYPCPDQHVEQIRFEALERGPLWCTYSVTYEAGERTYEVHYRLDAGSSHVRIHEHSRLGHDVRWELDLYPGLRPSRATYGHHSTWQRTRDIDLDYSGQQHLGDLQAPEQNMHFFVDDFDAFSFLGKGRAVSICAADDGLWSFAPQNPISMLPLKGPKLVLRASCKAGVRRWLLHAGPPNACRRQPFSTTDIGRLRRKYDTTLDWVKDLALEWDEIPARRRPHAVCTREDLERARRLFRTFAPLRRYGEFIDRDAEMSLGQYHSGGHYPLDDERREDPVSAWLMKPDRKIAGIIKRGLLKGLRSRVDCFLGPDGHRAPDISSINLGRLLRPFVQIYDLLGPHLKMTAAERRYLKAAVAFLAYKINDRNYWNAEGIVLHSDHPKSYHRTAWFPSRESDWNTYNIDTAPHNFHNDLYTALGCAAMTFPNHPEANTWLNQSLSYAERELDNWVFPNGAFIESATYTLATMYWWVPYFASLKHTRRKNYFLDKRFQRLCRSLARVQGPYDRRIRCHSFTVMGDAMYPSSGGNILAWVGHLAREDRGFAATMMGAWKKSGRQLNKPGQQGLSMYDAVYIDPSRRARELRGLPSEHVKGLGLILRSDHGDRDREVYCFIKCGKIYSHFHYDEGSFFLLADGVPLLDEYGVQYGSGTDESGETVPGYMPHLHNGISFSETPTDRECYNRGFITQFVTTPYADYAVCEMPVHLLHMREGMSLWGFTGEEAPYGWWRRHILFVKPHAFFFHDELETEFSATLDLNFKADSWDKVGSVSRVYRGRYGTDIPVCINQPEGPELRDRRLNMVASENSFPKFSTMESVSQEMKDTFYNQLSWHAKAPAHTDFNWALAWARPEERATLQPLGRGAPGASLQMASGTTCAVIAPWLREAHSHQDRDVTYLGCAGAVRRNADGSAEYLQMNGTEIGVPGRPLIRGDGPFRARVKGKSIEIDVSGNARWLEVHGAKVSSALLNGKRVGIERVGEKAARVSLPTGESQLVFR